ncbi:MAG: hypothetical protein U0804_12545 [Gemmataceae bacterium]
MSEAEARLHALLLIELLTAVAHDEDHDERCDRPARVTAAA